MENLTNFSAFAASLGAALIAISALGSVSNWINGRFLNYKIVFLLYYVGALVHEASHAIVCLFTGAKIQEFSVLARQPHVTYLKPKLPIVSNILISLAPIVGGIGFLYLVNRFWLTGAFTLPELNSVSDLWLALGKLLAQIRIFHWQSWVMILLFLNAGAMIGPSARDLKNIWPALIILLFVSPPFLVHLALLAILLILANIAVQIILGTVLALLGRMHRVQA